MYKVFINDCPIILTDNHKIFTKWDVIPFEIAPVVNIVGTLFKQPTSGICLFSSDLEEDWKKFQSYFIVEKAAGGKVLDVEKKSLFIYRFGKWDLPKGKLEKNETLEACAIREVEEECGITNLQIQQQLQTTYHIFKRNNKWILKITYWFLMHTTYTGKLTPQTEEGIGKVIFKNNTETTKALKNSYENIRLLF